MKRLTLSVLLLSFLIFSVPVQATNYTRTSEKSKAESFFGRNKLTRLSQFCA